MGKCINHSDKETSYLCMKHGVYMCEECVRCRDPKIYCKFRPSCVVSLLQKEQVSLGIEMRAIVSETGLPYQKNEI